MTDVREGVVFGVEPNHGAVPLAASRLKRSCDSVRVSGDGETLLFEKVADRVVRYVLPETQLGI